MKKLNVLALFAIAVLFAACGGGKGGSKGEKFDLCYNLEKDAVYNQKMDMDMKVEVSGSGQTMEMSMGMLGEYAFKVTDITNETFTCETTIGDMEMRMSMMGKDVVFSSKEGASSTVDPNMPVDMSAIFKQMKSSSFTSVMDKKGNMVKVEGVDLMLEGVVASLNLPEETASSVLTEMKGQYGDSKMKEQFKNMALYPDTPVAIGESWQRNIKMEGATSMDMENTYTLETVSDETFTIAVKSKIKMEFNNVPMEGTQDGSIVVYRKTGWLKNANLNQELAGKVSQGGMDFNAKAKGVIAISE